MTVVARYLITTADERTWKFDRPVVFLGEWCRVFDRKHAWESMDAIVADPYGLASEQKDTDDTEARFWEEKLLIVLRDTLNQFHGTEHDSRFWRIVLGHWLRRYVDVIFNRVRTLEQCLQRYRLNGTTAIITEYDTLATTDSEDAIWKFNDDKWNNALYIRILELFKVADLPIEYVSICEASYTRKVTTSRNVSLSRKFMRRSYRLMGKLAEFLVRNKDALIINSYLPKKELIKFQLAIWQVPQLWISTKFKATKHPDRKLRQKLKAQIADITNNKLGYILYTLVLELIPSCYLENFKELKYSSQQLRWPQTPRFIFTSNSFDTDEIFKLWTASKVESGYHYIAGQHGNNYGTHRYFGKLTSEETATDKFLTWGWSDGLPQHTPSFILKLARLDNAIYSKDGGLLLIELGEPLRITTWDCTYEFGNYFKDQLDFVDGLNKSCRRYLTVRLPQANIYSRWSYANRWREFDSEVDLDNGHSKLSELIERSRLIVHSYDSTGLLETLSQNIPTLVFWQNNFDYLRDNAKYYYQGLLDAGIVHLTPQSAADKVNEIWDDVAGWWMQDSVQEARKCFCEQYARTSQNPIKDLKNIFHEFT